MLTLEIRDAQPEDVDSVLALWKVAEATESVTDGPEAIDRLLRRDHVALLVAQNAGEIIGSVIGTYDGWRGNVYRLAVHPAHRRLGVARNLLATLDERFTKWGVKRATALVEHEHASAVAFWDATPYEHDQRMIRYVRTVDDADSGADDAQAR